MDKRIVVEDIFDVILRCLDIREAFVELTMCGTLSTVLGAKTVENCPALGKNIQLSPPGPSQFSKSLSGLNI
jgi:hypothetical protein